MENRPDLLIIFHQQEKCNHFVTVRIQAPFRIDQTAIFSVSATNFGSPCRPNVRMRFFCVGLLFKSGSCAHLCTRSLFWAKSCGCTARSVHSEDRRGGFALKTQSPEWISHIVEAQLARCWRLTCCGWGAPED